MLKKLTNKKLMISSVFIMSLTIANVIAGKILQIGPFIVPGAFITYAITFLMTDLASELYGREEAQKLVNTGFIVSLFATLMIFLTGLLPVAPFASATQEAYQVLLGANFRVVAGSMVAYYVSQTWDVWMFEVCRKKTGSKMKWVRNNLSTMTSQILDTAIFITIAFWGSVPNIPWMIVSQYLLKFVIAALDTPLFYLLTKETNGKD